MLSDGVYVLEVYPFPQIAAEATEADRKKLPEVGAPSVAKYPTLERTQSRID